MCFRALSLLVLLTVSFEALANPTGEVIERSVLGIIEFAAAKTPEGRVLFKGVMGDSGAVLGEYASKAQALLARIAESKSPEFASDIYSRFKRVEQELHFEIVNPMARSASKSSRAK